jgi:hypothetical protein
MNINRPTVFWQSDPVAPNETLVVSGDHFSEDSVVSLAKLNKNNELGKWIEIKPLETAINSIKAVIPDKWESGIYAMRIKCGKLRSQTVYVNAVNAWWMQGDEGVNTASVGGWLRLFGPCVHLDDKCSVTLTQEKVSKTLEAKGNSQFDLGVTIPQDISPGMYDVQVNNGYGQLDQTYGSVEIRPARVVNPRLYNVVSQGADPTGKKDCTLQIVQAMERLTAMGGGVIYFPRGRYRIDSILRSGTFIETSLKINPGITLRGEGKELVNLWWTDHETPLPSLIEGSSDFAIEDISIYVQGKHSTIITGESNVRINNVCIRANCYYMTNNYGKSHHKRVIEGEASTGSTFHFIGNNIHITNCDVYTSRPVFDMKHCRGMYLANNTSVAHNMFFFAGCSEVIFENNQHMGCDLTAGGSNVAMHMGATIARNTYIANNKISHLYGGDHEAMTHDGHATGYLGKVKNVKGTQLALHGKPFPKSKAKGSMADLYETALFILDGRGKGQYRFLKEYKGSQITIDRPWDVDPDETSLITISGYNGRNLYLNNTYHDTGTPVQLYPPNCECIVAGNKMYRTSNMNSLGKLGKHRDYDFVRVEMSWYNQFLDNHYVIGNGWGGGGTEIDRWIGGDTCLNIWGWHVFYYEQDGHLYDRFLTAEQLQETLKEKKPRDNSLPLSIFQIIRRHKVDNNSSIRVRGVVEDVLIENCQINNSFKGIKVEAQISYQQPQDIGQLFDYEPAVTDESSILTFLKPQRVLLRHNTFKHVDEPYLGNMIQEAHIVE